MRIVIVTQDEPFYLSDHLDYLLRNLEKNMEVVGCVMSAPSPFGKKESFQEKAFKTFAIFGMNFFIYYTLKYVWKRMLLNQKVPRVLKRHGIPVIELSDSINSPESVDKIKSYKPDLLISILGNEIFKKPIIELAPKGCINLHSALLPKYRGLMPSFWAMKNDETETGVSVFFVDEGIDSGPIIVQESINIEQKSLEQLIRETKLLGMDCIRKAVNLIETDSTSLIENPDAESTYYSFPTRNDVAEFRRMGKRFF